MMPSSALDIPRVLAYSNDTEFHVNNCDMDEILFIRVYDTGQQNMVPAVAET